MKANFPLMPPSLLCGLPLLFISLPLKAAPSQTKKAKSSLPKSSLQGKWRALKATSNGEDAPKGILAKLTLVFVGDTVSIMGAPPTRFKVNTKFAPAHIDFLNSRHQVGIYKLDGDTLALCTGQNGDRPRSFATKKYTDHTYLLLKRVKK